MRNSLLAAALLAPASATAQSKPLKPARTVELCQRIGENPAMESGETLDAFSVVTTRGLDPDNPVRISVDTRRRVLFHVGGVEVEVECEYDQSGKMPLNNFQTTLQGAVSVINSAPKQVRSVMLREDVWVYHDRIRQNDRDGSPERDITGSTVFVPDGLIDHMHSWDSLDFSTEAERVKLQDRMRKLVKDVMAELNKGRFTAPPEKVGP